MANSLSLLAYYVHYTKYSPAPPFHSQQYADKASFINTNFTTTRTHLQSSSRGNGCPAASNILPQQTHATIREFTSMYSINTTFRRLHSLDAELSRVYSALLDSQHQHQDEALQGKSGTPHCWPIHNIKATTIVEQNSLSSVVRFGQSSQLVTVSWTTLLRALPTQGFEKGKVSQSTVIIREEPFPGLLDWTTKVYFNKMRGLLCE